MANANKRIQSAAAEGIKIRATKETSSQKSMFANSVIKTAKEFGKQNRIKVKGK